ncbi:hypothetical protein HHK36_028232 [Tetracentron sinense]|uniref:Pentatricopeptide repeat-containing protein n=1 Tax=Tetracentron sinense TaxID=13715 RepID=A0A835D1X4_TETSI|nr:hypothetical protein HHK36_028232 [Tetracentron sinense]
MMFHAQGASKHTCGLLAVLCGKIPELVSSWRLEVQTLINPTTEEFHRVLKSSEPNFVYYQGEQLLNDEEIGSLVWGGVDLSAAEAISGLFGPSLLSTSVVVNEDFQFFLRIPNSSIRTLDIIKGIGQIFTNIFCQKSDIVGHKRTLGHGELSPTTLEDLMGTVGNQYQIRTQNWLSQKRDYDDERDPQAVFNALDTMLKDSLERLRMIRESIVMAGTLWECSSETDFTGYVAIIRALCVEGKVGAALRLRNRMIQKCVIPDVLTHNYLVNGLCKMGDMEKADWLIKEMAEVGPSPNCVTYNTLIDGYCHLNNVDKALYLFSMMGKSGIRPNRITCNILVHALCKKGLLEDAKKLLREILDDDCGRASSDLITSTTLINGYCKNEDLVQALEIWDEMCQKGTQMDVVAYNVLIHGFCLHRDMILAYRYFCEMFKKGFLPDVFTYNTLISGLCKEGKFDEACEIYSAMLRMGVEPDQISYKMVIRGLCLEGNVVKANEFLLCMLENLTIPNPLIWNVVIDGYGRCGDISHAILIRDQMLAVGVLPNIFTYNALIHAQVKGGNILEAQSLKQEMLSNGLFPDVVTYNLLIGAVCSFGHIRVALQLHDEMLRRGYEPDIITYTELIQGHCMNGNMKEAEELFVKIQKSGLSIDHVPFQILIKKYCKMKQPDRAFDLYKKMVEKGHMSHLSTSYALISELRKKGLIQEAIQVLRQLAPDVSYHSLVTLGIASIQGASVAAFEKDDAERLLFFCTRQGKDLLPNYSALSCLLIWMKSPAPSQNRSEPCQETRYVTHSGPVGENGAGAIKRAQDNKKETGSMNGGQHVPSTC